MSDVETMLASAAAGRPVAVSRAEGNEGVWSNGIDVFAPDTGDHRLAVFVQGAMIRSGSFDRRLMARLVGRKALAQRYLVVEATRAVLEVGPLAPTCLVERFAELPVPKSCAPAESLEIATTRVRLPQAPEEAGTLRPLRAHGPLAPGSGRAGNESAQKTDDGERSSILAAMASPLARDNLIARLFRSVLGGADECEGAEAAATAGAIDADSRGKSRRARGAGTGGPESARSVLQASAPGRKLPEWDCHRTAYKAEHVTVHHRDQEAPPTALVSDSRLPPRTQRQLRQVLLGYRKSGFASYGDDLDLDAVVDYALSRRRDLSRPPAVFVRHRRTTPRATVSVLFDASDSTGERTGPDTVYQQNVALAGSLVRALDDAGVRVALTSFRSWGRHDVRLVHHRTSRHQQRAHTAIAALEASAPSGYTRAGAAIRGCIASMGASQGVRRILVIIGDGTVYDDGYQDRYAAEDTAMAIREATDAGVSCVSVGVDAPMPPRWDPFGTAASSARGDRQQVQLQLASAVAVGAHLAQRRRDQRSTPGSAAAKKGS